MTAKPLSPRLPAGGTRWLGLLGFGLAVLCTAVVGSLAATGSKAEYASLEQPAWAPPSWLFGPVWTILYVLIAIAGWLVWQRTGWTRALTVYAVQLALNAAWTPLFFAAGRYGLALVEIMVLWVLILATIVLFWRTSRLAAALLVPYLAWVSFATALNAAIWSAN
ncbi:TspO/MBR family protein [Actinoplanes sp. NPDC026623]|uniref:TspO/MBR family protein n=1 Tax=Actinoplanes sp. NPDC026623 TaxID=3155610 RepID=UPI0033EB0C5E